MGACLTASLVLLLVFILICQLLQRQLCHRQVVGVEAAGLLVLDCSMEGGESGVGRGQGYTAA